MFVYRRVYQNSSKHIYIYTYICVCVIWVWLTAHNSCRLHTVDSCGLCCPIGHGRSRRNNDSGKANVLTSTTIITWNQWNRHGPNTTMMAKIILASIFAQVKDTQKSTSVLIPYYQYPICFINQWFGVRCLSTKFRAKSMFFVSIAW